MVGGFGVGLSATHNLRILNSGVEHLKLMNVCEAFISKHTGKCHVSILYFVSVNDML